MYFKNIYNHLLQNKLSKPQPNKGMHTPKGELLNHSLRNSDFNLDKQKFQFFFVFRRYQ